MRDFFIRREAGAASARARLDGKRTTIQIRVSIGDRRAVSLDVRLGAARDLHAALGAALADAAAAINDRRDTGRRE
jgi:hypothetical protein